MYPLVCRYHTGHVAGRSDKLIGISIVVLIRVQLRGRRVVSQKKSIFTLTSGTDVVAEIHNARPALEGVPPHPEAQTLRTS